MALETEIKIRIETSSVQTLKLHLGTPGSLAEQRNTYMDSNDGFLRRRKEMVRVRHVVNNDQWILCFKGRQSSEEGLFKAIEHEWELSEREARAFLDSPATQEERLSSLIPEARVALLNTLGTLTNRRTSYPLETGHTLELDEILFPDGTIEAEIEVELDEQEVPAVRALLDTLLSSLDVSSEPQGSSKFVRFLRNTDQMI